MAQILQQTQKSKSKTYNTGRFFRLNSTNSAAIQYFYFSISCESRSLQFFAFIQHTKPKFHRPFNRTATLNTLIHVRIHHAWWMILFSRPYYAWRPQSTFLFPATSSCHSCRAVSLTARENDGEKERLSVSDVFVCLWRAAAADAGVSGQSIFRTAEKSKAKCSRKGGEAIDAFGNCEAV